ncbi:hypothetical protein AVEN_80580-1 [Araneus ventricosus]|uniref:Uncharacterized protein n=1 Tax=Araneus ventricosus TaxID=182803 RepID=A0A4Y2UW05_ARAVE|nr:hypothetical protein AVEN_80580-1 [Araneus ventricosus]
MFSNTALSSFEITYIAHSYFALTYFPTDYSTSKNTPRAKTLLGLHNSCGWQSSIPFSGHAEMITEKKCCLKPEQATPWYFRMELTS